MKRGIVLEVEGCWATVLTPDGRFLRVRVPRQKWWPGEEVSWSGRKPWLALRPAVALACALLLLLGGGGIAYQHYWAVGPVVAYVGVDINPSLELGIDARERVSTAEPLNADGERLLAGFRYRRRPLGAVLADLTARAVDRGYLGKDDADMLLLTITPAEKRTVSAEGSSPAAVGGATAGGATVAGGAVPPTAGGGEVSGGAAPPTAGGGTDAELPRARARLATAAEQALQAQGVKAVVKVLATEPAVRREARERKLSPGRLVLYLAARQEGVPLDLDQLRQGPLGQVLRQAWERQLAGKPDQPPQPAKEPQPAKGRLPAKEAPLPPRPSPEEGSPSPEPRPEKPGGISGYPPASEKPKLAGKSEVPEQPAPEKPGTGESATDEQSATTGKPGILKKPGTLEKPPAASLGEVLEKLTGDGKLEKDLLPLLEKFKEQFPPERGRGRDPEKHPPKWRR